MIKGLFLTEVFNSCGEKTIKVSIKTDKGVYSADSPAGTSRGSYEAKTLSFGRTRKEFLKVRGKFKGKDEGEVDEIIEKIGIEKVGSGFSTALSMAAVRALTSNNPYRFFDRKAKTFPYPLGNVIGGGAHSGYISEQEFLVIPVKAKTIKEAMELNLSIWKELGNVLKTFLIGRNRENAWMCKLNDLKSLDILSNLADDLGARVGIDFAANSIYDGRYCYKHSDRKLSADRQLDFVLGLIKTYRLVYVEDPFREDDFDSFAELTRKAKCLVVGDDLFATQSSRLKQGIRTKSGNAVIIKPNQAGTIARTLDAVNMAKKARFTTVVSHRSCETEDSFISDLALGTGSPIIKCGVFGKEREAKLNRLVDIWNKVDKPEMARLNFL